VISPRQGVVVAGRYALVRQLARGGMGSVWLARHKELDIDVTVKFMAPTLIASSEARIRFEREAKIAARLHSQHVVHVLDYGVADGTPYFAMELLKGESLATRLTRDGRLTIPQTAKIVVQIAKALKTAHEIGLVHRDMKPSNIFLSLRDDEEVIKVLDFGVAKLEGLGEATANTESGVLLGTVHYMSPEQIRSSRAVDARSDLWSTGVVLYRALTGKLPFPGRDVGDILVRVCTDPIEPASVAAPDLPPEIDAFFERALARDPDQRFQTAAELSDAFCALALGKPQAPRPVKRFTQTVVMAPSQAKSALEEYDQAANDGPPASARTMVVEDRNGPVSAGSAKTATFDGAAVSAAATIERPYPQQPLPSPGPITVPHAFAFPATDPLPQRHPSQANFAMPNAVSATIPIMGSSISRAGATGGFTPLQMTDPRGARKLGIAWPLWAIVAGVTVATIFFIALRSGTASSASGVDDHPATKASIATAEPPAPAPSATSDEVTAVNSVAPAPPPATEAPEAATNADARDTGAATRPSDATRGGRGKPAPVPPSRNVQKPARGAANPLDRQD
jgi:serine/threonine protein kinase